MRRALRPLRSGRSHCVLTIGYHVARSNLPSQVGLVATFILSNARDVMGSSINWTRSNMAISTMYFES
jgi:hypothetical protein